MAINSLIDHIANHGTDGSVTVGANTPAPYANANLTGFVDGTGPQNASKNMAEFYNRQVFAAKHLIEAAGLTWDPANWAQMTQAVIALGGGLHGGSCAVTGPTAPPSTASPYTKYTSVAPYLEEWEWTPVNGWQPVSNLIKLEALPSSAVSGNFNISVVAKTLVAPRSGRVIATSSHGGTWSGTPIYANAFVLVGYLGKPGEVAWMSQSTVPGVNFAALVAGSNAFDVSAGDIIFTVFSNQAGPSAQISVTSSLKVVYQ